MLNQHPSAQALSNSPTLSTSDRSLKKYLAEVRSALAGVPEAEREQLMHLAQAELELDLELRGLSDDTSVQAWKGSPAAFAERLRVAHTPARSETTPPVHQAGLLADCRTCGRAVSMEALACPHCGAPMPTRKNWKGHGYEFKSEKMLMGLPLVHIAYGRDEHGKLRTAKGFIAIGQFARGYIAIGQFAAGAIFALGQFAIAPIALGQFALGLLALGQFGIALLAGMGMFATGLWAKGFVAWPFLGR